MMIKLTCGSCGASMDLPDNLGLAHCKYCGNKILIDRPALDQERRSIDRYAELSRVALAAKSYSEAVKYANKVLNIDPKAVSACIYKAIGTFELTSRTRNRYAEAMEYLSHAERLSPDDERIVKWRDHFMQRQIARYLQLGNETLGAAGEQMTNGRQGRASKRTVPLLVKALEYFIEASKFAPADVSILERIKLCVQHIRFHDAVNAALLPESQATKKLKWLEHLNELDRIEKELVRLRAVIAKDSKELKRLQARGGLLSGFAMSALKADISRNQIEIRRLEALIAPGRPTGTF
jgi:tetratricopeptide (TPR) repeat protein